MVELQALSRGQDLLMHVPDYVKAMQPYRPGKPLEEMKEELGLAHVIKLASNENPRGASPKAIEAVSKVLTQSYRYPDPVSRKLRRQIGERLHVDPDEIIVTGGSESLLGCIVRTMIEPGQLAMAPFGAFMGFSIYLAGQGGQLIQVPSPQYQFDIDGIIEACGPEIRVLYLPNPNNPTGTYFTHADLKRLLEAVSSETLVVLDEAYYEYCADLPDYPDALALRQDNLLILRTFSKAYGLAGLRVGYGIGEKRLVEQLSKLKMTFEVTLAGQVAAEAAWDDHDFLTQSIAENAREKARFYQAFEALGLRYIPSAGNFVMIECPAIETVEALNQALLQRGIAIRPLTAFGFPQCVRISVGLPEENDALFAALKEICPHLSMGILG